MDFYEIGGMLKKIRADKKITQAELANKAGITRQTVSKLENGEIDKVSVQVFVKMLDALDYELQIEEKKPFYYFDPEGIR